MSDKKIKYNKSSSYKYGWKPNWFGATGFDLDLLRKVEAWQASVGLASDGLVGPMTYRRRKTEMDSESDLNQNKIEHSDDNKFIVHNGKRLPIEWNKVVLWSDPNGLSQRKGSYRDLSGKPTRRPTMFVNHWDVCLSSESCSKVLNNRGLSVHFLIDNDGTIYQTLDTQHEAWHAGLKGLPGGNKRGIGVEISNAYYPKYQNWYVKNGFGERPLLEGVSVHGKELEPFLGFYPVQLEALKALWKACHLGLDIPLTYPGEDAGALITGVYEPCARGTFKGFCNHYNFTEAKQDCAGLEIDKLILEI